jgi:hypothetical protein
MIRCNGKWPGGRTFLDRYGRTRWPPERLHNGACYSRRLDARNEHEALAEQPLLERGPDAYLIKAEAAEKAAANAVFLKAEQEGRFLPHLEAKGRTERYRWNSCTFRCGMRMRAGTSSSPG